MCFDSHPILIPVLPSGEILIAQVGERCKLVEKSTLFASLRKGLQSDKIMFRVRGKFRCLEFGGARFLSSHFPNEITVFEIDESVSLTCANRISNQIETSLSLSLTHSSQVKVASYHVRPDTRLAGFCRSSIHQLKLVKGRDPKISQALELSKVKRQAREDITREDHMTRNAGANKTSTQKGSREGRRDRLPGYHQTATHKRIQTTTPSAKQNLHRWKGEPKCKIRLKPRENFVSKVRITQHPGWNGGFEFGIHGFCGLSLFRGVMTEILWINHARLVSQNLKELHQGYVSYVFRRSWGTIASERWQSLVGSSWLW